jgi:hypothetical protein
MVEVDCAAEQEQQQVQGVGGGAAAAGSFGAQVQQMAQNSVALQIAINQVGRAFGWLAGWLAGWLHN